MKKIMFMSIAGAVIVGSLSGCSAALTGTPEHTQVSTPSASASTADWTPTYVNIAGLNGKEVSVKPGGYVEIDTKRDAHPNTWIPASSDEKVATTRHGSPNGFGAPVVEALSKGVATISLKNETSGEVVTFSLKVE